MLSRFHLVPERNGQTDGQTDRFAISISRVSMLTRDKKQLKTLKQSFCYTFFTHLQPFNEMFIFSSK